MQADRAKQLITQAIHLAPGVAKYRRSLGIVYQEMERWSDALTAFEHANDKEPNNVQVRLG